MENKSSGQSSRPDYAGWAMAVVIVLVVGVAVWQFFDHIGLLFKIFGEALAGFAIVFGALLAFPRFFDRVRSYPFVDTKYTWMATLVGMLALILVGGWNLSGFAFALFFLRIQLSWLDPAKEQERDAKRRQWVRKMLGLEPEGVKEEKN